MNDGLYTIRRDDWRQTTGGLYVPVEAEEPRPTGIDLFCGAGGMSLGFMQAGFEVLAACDNDPTATHTYLVNLGAYPVEMHYTRPEDRQRLTDYFEKQYPGTGKVSSMEVSGSARNPEYPGVPHFFFGDVRRLTGAAILQAIGKERDEVDCVFGGPPCQGFSTSGKRQIVDPRNSLVFEFARVVLEIQPKAFMFENVPGLLTMVTPEGLPVLDAFCRVIEDGGFGAFNALKRSLLCSSGHGAVLRNERATKKKRKRLQPEPENEQPTLFS